MRNTVYGEWQYTEKGYCQVVKKRRNYTSAENIVNLLSTDVK